ncbi:Protein-L-isoaspartate O-methyltransferase [Labeo rohita]|uniref:Protein-L-isoaspartate O-methyltransferase n=1 Tax=Labeo rohita TaxID=84645 RepID=A0ABQ8LIJ6_LABRO|nr:Protein-L-isoaspartate O-methyltransferase [Labeo rohita]
MPMHCYVEPSNIKPVVLILKPFKREGGQTEHKSMAEFPACFIPPVTWVCLLFLDGDYLACGLTDWNGNYTCDKMQNPNCLNGVNPVNGSKEEQRLHCMTKHEGQFLYQR